MNRAELRRNYHLRRADLMDKIIDIRYVDLMQERDYCEQLLELSEMESDTYGIAFASVYLLDSYLALGEFRKCSQPLIRGRFLCEKHGYTTLHLVLCNCAGLYYLKLNDEQTALQYYLDGLRIAREKKDYVMQSKLLNNIGFGFGGREDWESAKTYFQMSYETIAPYVNESNSGAATSALCNMAEAANVLGDARTSKRALELCEKIEDSGPHSLHKHIRLGCAWCSYYTMLGDREHYIAVLDELLKIDLLKYENRYFICDMLEGLCSNMMTIGDQPRCMMFLKMLEELEPEVSKVNSYHIQCLRIQYYQHYFDQEKLDMAYKRFYEVEKELSKTDSQARAQSMLSKIELSNALEEQETIYRENRQLKSDSQLDGLTGLYNRRYFNKLISKVMQNQKLETMGIIMIDIDYFKGYNDYYGHQAGDDALKTVAAILNEQAPGGLFASRFGGDEFVCLCVNLKDEQIEQYLDDVRQRVQEENIPYAGSQGENRITLSIGYCNELLKGDIDTAKLLRFADQALYQVKKAGRNEVAKYSGN